MWGEIKKAINSNLNKTLDVLIQERSTETNQKIDSKASQTSVNSLDTKVQNINTSLGTTNSKVDSKASQTSVDNLDTKVQAGNNLIGATNNTGGTATSGSIFAKLNKLLTDWTTARAGYIDTTISSRASQDTVNNINTNVGALVNGRVVKSVQRGVLILKVDTIWTVPLTSINPSKSQVLLDGISYSSGSFDILPYVLNLTSSSLVIDAMVANDSMFEYKISWQVIEFY